MTVHHCSDEYCPKLGHSLCKLYVIGGDCNDMGVVVNSGADDESGALYTSVSLHVQPQLPEVIEDDTAL